MDTHFLKRTLFTILLALFMPCTQLAAQQTDPADTLCNPLLIPTLVDGIPQDKAIPVHLRNRNEVAQLELKASMRKGFGDQPENIHYTLMLNDVRIGSFSVNKDGCIAIDASSLNVFVDSLEWMQSFTDAGIGQTLNELYARRRYKPIEWGGFESNHVEIAAQVSSSDAEALEPLVERYMMAREENKPLSFEYFREAACFADGTCYYSCYTNELEYPQSQYSRIRRQHYFRRTPKGRLTHIVERKNNGSSEQELVVAGVIAALTESGENPADAFPLTAFSRFGPEHLDMDYFQTQDGRFFVREDFSLSYEAKEFDSTTAILVEWGKRCVYHQYVVGQDSVEFVGWHSSEEMYFRVNERIDSLGVLEGWSDSTFSVERDRGEVSLVTTRNFYTMPDIAEPPTEAQPSDFFSSLEQPALPMDAATLEWDQNITDEDRLRLGGWIADALERLQRFAPADSNLFDNRINVSENLAPGSSFHLVVLGSMHRWLFQLALTRGLDMLDHEKRPFDALTLGLHDGDPQQPRMITTVLIIDWILWNGEQPESEERIEAKLSTILAHELFGNASRFVYASHDQLLETASNNQMSIDQEIAAFDAGIEFLQRYIASEEFQMRSPAAKRAYRDVLSNELRMKATWQRGAGK